MKKLFISLILIPAFTTLHARVTAEDPLREEFEERLGQCEENMDAPNLEEQKVLALLKNPELYDALAGGIIGSISAITIMIGLFKDSQQPIPRTRFLLATLGSTGLYSAYKMLLPHYRKFCNLPHQESADFYDHLDETLLGVGFPLVGTGIISWMLWKLYNEPKSRNIGAIPVALIGASTIYIGARLANKSVQHFRAWQETHKEQ